MFVVLRLVMLVLCHLFFCAVCAQSSVFADCFFLCCHRTLHHGFKCFLVVASDRSSEWI